MIEFKEISLRDRNRIRKLLLAENSQTAEYTFGTLYCWAETYPVLVCEYENRLLIKSAYSENAFYYPVGFGELRPAIDKILELSEKPQLYFLTEGQKQRLETEYPSCFTFREERNFAEYIYKVGKLSTYSGQSLHGKRNHCNQFAAAHKWRFVPLTQELIPVCSEMLEKWMVENIERLDKSIADEYVALKRAIDTYDVLELDGGVLFADGCAAGFSLGEMVNQNTFVVHFEKAYPNMPGAYSMVCREMTRSMMEKYPALVYINREEDMGLDLLRYSKLSYHPEYLLKEYTATWKEDDYGTTGI